MIEEYLLYGAFFWSVVFGFIFGWTMGDEPARIVFLTERPAEAPPPEAFE